MCIAGSNFVPPRFSNCLNTAMRFVAQSDSPIFWKCANAMRVGVSDYRISPIHKERALKPPGMPQALSSSVIANELAAQLHQDFLDMPARLGVVSLVEREQAWRGSSVRASLDDNAPPPPAPTRAAPASQQAVAGAAAGTRSRSPP